MTHLLSFDNALAPVENKELHVAIEQLETTLAQVKLREL